MLSKRYTLLLLLLLSFCQLKAQDQSNRGREFWVGYGLNYHFYPNADNVINDQEMALYISTELAATVTLSINGTAWSQTLNIPANTVNASILIPKSGAADARILSDGLSERAIHILSDVPVAVFAHQYSNQNSGATILMPVESYGYSYYSVNYYQTTADLNQANWYCYFYTVATEDNTRLEITPSDTTKNGWLPGQTYTVNLNKGQIFSVFGKATFNGIPAFGSKDLTGSKIISVPGSDGNCHPFALFAGSGGIRLCRGDGAEIMHQQVFPVQSWGTKFLTYHTINNGNSDLLETNRNYYRICVSDPLTIVRKNGTVLTGLQKNFFYEYMDSTGGDFIETDRPALISQYTPSKNQCWRYPNTSPSPPAHGDPEMIYLSPLEQGQKSVTVWASRQSSAVDYVYSNIIIPSTGVSSLKVDGNSLPAGQIITHPNYPTYSVAIFRHIGPAAQHTITSDSNFTGIIYGMGNYESYGYNIGANINNLNDYSAIKNTFNTSGNIDTFTCPKTPVRLILKLGFPATTITWQLSQLPGITPNADSIIPNPIVIGTEIINGRTYYLYSLQQDFSFANTGTFYLPVVYTTAVTANCTRAGNSTIKIVVKPGPAANFSISGSGCLSDSVSFTGTYTANGFNITQYLWNFADNTTANTISTKKKFTTSGIQNVQFRAIADNGCAGDTTKPITILPLPTAKLGLPPSACTNENIAVTDTSIANAGTIVNWLYNFGDGTVVANNNGNSFFHQYKNAGTYIAKLIVSTASCKSDTSYKTIFISPGPTTKFGFDKNICLGDSIRFTDSSTITAGSITQWKWTFGDNNTATFLNNTPFYFKYAAVGVYTVTLQTTSSNGCTNSYSLSVSVNNKPSANITASGKPCVDSNFIFTSSLAFNSNNPAIWYWNFGNGQTATITNSNSITKAYNTATNNIIVKHTAGYGPGCFSDTVSYTIAAINANPASVPFNLSTISACAMEPVQFTANIPAGITNWLWKFGDGTIGNQIPPFSKSFTAANNYNVTLQVFNNAGCGSALSANNVIILPSPVINAGADKIISTGASATLDAVITNAANYNYLWTPATGLNAASILNPVTTTQQTITYSVIATDKTNNCTSTDSVKITVISKLFIPNAFTPNGDGKNDKWNIPALILYPDATVMIFNRFGEKIYESKNYTAKPWDGTFKSKKQPGGSYIYLIQLAPDKIEKGTVTIIR